MAVQFTPQAEPIPGYKLIEPLGRGGFGEVWKAQAPGGVLKAIKLVHGSLRSTHGEEVLVQQELKALTCVREVRHPYILAMDRFDIVDGQLLIVMELADKCLWDRFTECIKQNQTGIPRDELLRYMEETAEALDLMNIQYRLQHSDIKPQNLFLVHNHVKVADFGLTKDLKGMKALTGGCFSPVYAAPETFEGWVSPHSDQYSLAIVYQELLTGVRPFDGKNARQLLMQHMQQQPSLAALPPGDREAIARSLAKKPDDRFATCTEMVQALRRGARTPMPSAAVTNKTPISPPRVLEGTPGADKANVYHLTFATRCTGCGYTGRVPKKFTGLAVKCRACNLVFIATPMAEAASPAAPAATPPPAAERTPKPIAAPAKPTQAVLTPATRLPENTQRPTVLKPTAQAVSKPVIPVAPEPPIPEVECPVCGYTKHAAAPNQSGCVTCLRCGCVHASALAAPTAATPAPATLVVECPVCGCKGKLPEPYLSGSIKCHQCGCVHRVS